MTNSDRQSFLDRIRVSRQELNKNNNNNQSNSEDNTEDAGPYKGQRERDPAQEMQADKTERSQAEESEYNSSEQNSNRAFGEGNEQDDSAAEGNDRDNDGGHDR